MTTSLPTPTTALGNWYATALFWKPQAALFVNERTLLPVLVPLAPASELVQRFPVYFAELLDALEINAEFITSEYEEMDDVVYAKTGSRSLLGSMNDFINLAEAFEGDGPNRTLLQISTRLAKALCKPIGYRSPEGGIARPGTGYLWGRQLACPGSDAVVIFAFRSQNSARTTQRGRMAGRQ